MALVALSLSAFSGCALGPLPARDVEVGVAPVFTGVAGELIARNAQTRQGLVRVLAENSAFKPARRYFLGVADSFFGALNPHPYWEWPYRVIRFPLYLLFGYLDLGSSRGSGFFVSSEYVVTNAHVVDNAAEVACQLSGGEVRPAEIVAVDPVRDLALLRVPGGGGTPLELRKEAASPGELALAIGYPSRDPVGEAAGFDEDRLPPNPRLTVGVISAVQVELGNPATRYVELDAALNPGNSGGPVIGLDGKVIGVATMVTVGRENEGYAVPSATIRAIFADHLQGTEPKREPAQDERLHGASHRGEEQGR